MTNLWEFFLQTLYVTLIGSLLLLVKWLLKDKLTPRWHSFVWVVLAVRVLAPAPVTGKFILLPLPLWVETLKNLVERNLFSAYASFYKAIAVTAPIPWLKGRPVSVTDWLFLLYAAGVAVVLVRYLWSYLRLRRLLRQGTPAPDAILQKVQQIGGRHHGRVCPVVVLPGLPSPMVCGVFRPLLALPEGEPPDDHVLLHELLHIKYFDALQNLFWCFCRALHWCNPLVQLMLDRVGNDLESLCDQRVLERLEGEERRRYGLSLLTMANDRYPRAPGTTSISNGGRNIRRRIEAIARFKRYPRGMTLASVCVVVVLLGAAIMGTAPQKVKPVESWPQASNWDKAQALASLRLTRCSTVAGALDTYAKGMMTGEACYLAIASPAETRSALEREISLALAQGKSPVPVEAGTALAVYDMEEGGDTGQVPFTGRVADISLIDHVENYVVHNLREEPDGAMTAQLVFLVKNLQDFPSPDLMGWRNDLSNLPGVARFEVRLTKEDGWVVERTGPGQLYLGVTARWGMYYGDLELWPAGFVQQAVGEYGTVTKQTMSIYTVEQGTPQTEFASIFGGEGTVLNPIPNPHGSFSSVAEGSLTTCAFHPPQEEEQDFYEVGLQVANKKKRGLMPSFLNEMRLGSSSWGSEFGGTKGNAVSAVKTKGWTGEISVTGWQRYSPSQYSRMEFAAQIWWGGKPVETLILQDISTKGE